MYKSLLEVMSEKIYVVTMIKYTQIQMLIIGMILSVILLEHILKSNTHQINVSISVELKFGQKTQFHLQFKILN